jgi:multidrug efflux system outer membrane protein
LLALMLSGCAATPPLAPPQLDVPHAFREASAPATNSTLSSQPAMPAAPQAQGQWWLVFHDATLNALMADANQANVGMAVALARVRQARAIAGVASAQRIPQVGLHAGARRSATPELADGSPANRYSVGLSASYEADLFGRIGATVGAAQSDAAAAESNYQALRLAMQADVAQTYFRLRATDAELDTLRRGVALREENVRVNERRVALGDIGEFDLARARTELALVRAEATGLQRQRASDEHALAVLLGKPASDFSVGVNALAAADAPPTIPAGMPSALLERRPDITAAWQAMAASNARIGVARAARFPSLTISADGGGAAGAVRDVLNLSSRAWVLDALMSLPLIDGGRNKANIARSEAALEESMAAYRQSVLLAFGEVEDNLAALRILAEQAEQIDAALLSARRSADLAQKLYAAGRSSYLDLLDAQRNLVSSERTAAQLRGSRAAATVALIRSLGGGWERTVP